MIKIFQLLKNNKLNIFILLTVLLTFFMFSYHPLDADEGVILNGAWKMLDGQNLYQDFFEYIGPASFVLVFIIFKYSIVSYFVVKYTVLFFLLFALYLLSKIGFILQLTKKMVVAFILLWLYFLSYVVAIINHNFLSTIMAIIATFFLFKFYDQKKDYQLLLVGFFSGVTFCFLQSKGLLLIIALLIVLMLLPNVHKLKTALVYLFSTGTVIMTSILFYGTEQITNLWTIGSDYLLINNVIHWWWYLLLVIIFFLAVHLWRNKTNNRYFQLWILTVIQIALLLSIFNRPDYSHLILNIWPMIIIIIYYYQSYLPINNTVYYGLIILLITSCFLQGINNYNIYDSKEITYSMSKIINTEQIFTHPFLPGLYWELGKDNPYITSVPETIQGNAYFLQNNYQTLVEQQPRFIVTNYPMVIKFNYQNNVIDKYIKDNYQQNQKFGSLQLWEKK